MAVDRMAWRKQRQGNADQVWYPRSLIVASFLLVARSSLVSQTTMTTFFPLGKSLEQAVVPL